MAKTVGDFFWERMYQWGVRPGIRLSRRRHQRLARRAQSCGSTRSNSFRLRHEEMAAFMASAYAKFTGELGVCMATSGPGRFASDSPASTTRGMDHMPVLAIAGQQARAALGGHYQQELDLQSMFKDVAGAFVQQASVRAAGAPSDRPRRAHSHGRTAGHGGGPAERPAGGDVQEPAAQAWHGSFRRRLQRAARRAPATADLRRAAEVLNAGKKVAILVGAGALHATDEVIAVADKLRRRRGQGAARQGGAAGRFALGDGLDRPARHRSRAGT